jgi:hypothetical protein
MVHDSPEAFTSPDRSFSTLKCELPIRGRNSVSVSEGKLTCCITHLFHALIMCNFYQSILVVHVNASRKIGIIPWLLHQSSPNRILVQGISA